MSPSSPLYAYQYAPDRPNAEVLNNFVACAADRFFLLKWFKSPECIPIKSLLTDVYARTRINLRLFR